jgi:hypothetical protein
MANKTGLGGRTWATGYHLTALVKPRFRRNLFSFDFPCFHGRGRWAGREQGYSYNATLVRGLGVDAAGVEVQVRTGEQANQIRPSHCQEI